MKNKRYRFFVWLDRKTGYQEPDFMFTISKREIQQPLKEYNILMQLFILTIGILYAIWYPIEKLLNILDKLDDKLTVKEEEQK